MISLSHLNKITQFTFFFTILIFNSALAATAVDIWKKKENQNEQNNQTSEEEITIQSPILSDDVGEAKLSIGEKKIEESDHTVIGIFDPEENDFNLNMWSSSDGEDIKNILKRIDKLILSQFSEDLLFQVLFTNAYPPKTNLNSLEFLKIKIDWLIKNRRFKDLETLLQTNPNAGKEPKAINLLINQYLSSVDIKSACEKINFVSEEVQNDYLNKFTIYCLINDDRKDEAQLLLELLIESGFSDKFFEDKIGFLLGFKETTNQKIIDNNLLNFYLSHITSNDFNYKPNEKTDKYIWRYLSSANLININDIEDENVISTYEKAAANNSFDSEEIFNIYKQILFNVNQLINSIEIYKNLPNYKARALIYQSILLSDNIEKKLYFIFLLKDLFAKDKLLNVYSNELVNILQSIHPDEIPESYNELVKQNIEQNFNTIKNIKFDNDILHRSKVLKHFLEKNQKISKTEKDFKTVYKKIKKNKKYFISIKDIIVLESLEIDGITLPVDLDYSNRSSQLTIPKNLESLVNQKQTGLLMLKIVEIIGEDEIHDLDPETVYFLNRILNDLNLKKIRNNILIKALPVRV
ncbi:uncharacterized protein METZ01_LOCUS142466 [marine metagenome]|uniref:Uncharacterized protein n=1 Tax=marine metagenome TaxID=408172 RepID=A0A381ZL87_9ZZZZ